MLEDILKSIVKLPWIYQFFDKNWNIIYIWKSVNLFSRVNSYFLNKTKLNFAKQKMIEQISDIKTIICENEKESLILETTLIKKFLPKYNILMKDWKDYIYLKITDEYIARLIKTREKTKNWTYFWPYISTNDLNNILKVSKKFFWYRSCNIIFENKNDIWVNNLSIKSKNWHKIPCMDFYINRCAGPCLLKKENIKKYIDWINNIKNILKWDFKSLLKTLDKNMRDEAKKLNFEEAQKIKDSISSIESLNIKQNLRENIKWNLKFINYIEKFDNFYIWVIDMEDSKIIWYNNIIVENNLNENKEEIIKNFIENDYINNDFKNLKYIVPFSIDSLKEINIEVPDIWTKYNLLKLAYKNIYDFAYKKYLSNLQTKGFLKTHMINLLNIFWYKQINKTITFETYDISHISWHFTVASRSIMENWVLINNKYKKYKIKTLNKGEINDFSSLKEVISRRLKEMNKLWNIVDLIIIDWWKGQLSSVMNLIKEEDKEIYDNIQVISIAKKEEEVFLIDKENNNFKKIILDKDSRELNLIQKLRDEAHRFAITFNRDSRIKNMKKNILEWLNWFWAITRKKLLNKYGNIENLKNIPKEELKKILNKNQMDSLENHDII